MANTLTVNLVGNTASFQQQMKQSAASIRQVQSTATGMSSAFNSGMAGTTAASRRFQFGLQSLAYAVQDASSQIGTRGFSGALTAVSNNIPGVLGLLGGTALKWGLVGSAVAGVVSAYMMMSDTSKQVKKDTEELDESLKRIRDTLEERAKFEFELNAMRSGEDAKRQQDNLEKEIAGRKAALQETERQANAESRRIEELKKDSQGFRDSEGVMWNNPFASFFNGPSSEDIARLNKLRSEANKIKSEIQIAEQRRADITNASPAIKQREKEDEQLKESIKLQEEAKESAKAYYQATLTPAEKYEKELKKINDLKSSALISEETARRAAENAYKTMQAELNKGFSATVNLTPAIDKNSANALTGFNTALQAMYGRGYSPQASSGTAVSPNANRPALHYRPAGIPSENPVTPMSGAGMDALRRQEYLDARSQLEKQQTEAWMKTNMNPQSVSGAEALKSLLEKQLEVQKKTSSGIENLNKRSSQSNPVFSFN